MRRKPRPRSPGRPVRGPGSTRLGDNEEERLRQVREAYADISRRNKRPAQYAEVARRLEISTTTLWRFRNRYGWPP